MLRPAALVCLSARSAFFLCRALFVLRAAQPWSKAAAGKAGTTPAARRPRPHHSACPARCLHAALRTRAAVPKACPGALCRPRATPRCGHSPRRAAGARLKFKASVQFVPTSTPRWTLVCPVFNFSGEQHAHHCLASRRTYHRDHFADAVRSFLSYRPPAASLPLPVLQYTLQDTAPKKPPAPRRGFLLLGKANGGFGSAARPGRHGTAKPGAALRAAVVRPPQPGAMTACAPVQGAVQGAVQEAVPGQKPQCVSTSVQCVRAARRGPAQCRGQRPISCAGAALRTGTRRWPPTRSGFPPRRAWEC